MLTVFTDGSCVEGNPGKVGGGYILMRDGNLLGGEGFPCGTGTNNRGELEAAIAGLKAGMGKLQQGEDLLLVSDSQYMLDGMLVIYRRCRKDVPNNDLWKRLLKQLNALAENGSRCMTYWVRGHSATDGNKLCDALARQAATHNRRYKPQQRCAR